MSIIRVVDRVIQSATGAEPPELMPPIQVDNLQMVIALRSDQAKGRFTLKAVIEDPGTNRTQVGEQDINLTPGGGGVNLVVPMRLSLSEEGLYWINLMFGGPRGQEDQLLTRVPLEVVYERQRVPVSPGHPEE